MELSVISTWGDFFNVKNMKIVGTKQCWRTTTGACLEIIPLKPPGDSFQTKLPVRFSSINVIENFKLNLLKFYKS